MIVKLIIHKKFDAISIWNQEGQRLFYSAKDADIKTAKDLLTVIRAKTDKEVAQEVLGNPVPKEALLVQKMHGYFGAYWLNKIVQLKKRVEGYSW